MNAELPGPVLLFGSGEAAPAGRNAWDRLLRSLGKEALIAILETPAGFQPNSAWVAGQIAAFLRERLHHHRPQPVVIPARRKGEPYGPDNPDILRPLASAQAIFLGPGSPTYTVRHLRDTLAWEVLLQRWREGAAIVLASAAAIAVGRWALPVYEIYKAGADLHWQPGLDLFAPLGLHPVIVPHWNNTEGGEHLDTSRCFMGRERFARLRRLLPEPYRPILGLDEHTALLLDWRAGTAEVLGKGQVTLLRRGTRHTLPPGRHRLADLDWAPLPVIRWPAPSQAARDLMATRSAPEEPPEEVRRLLAARTAARQRRDWTTADALRERIRALGWEVRDTPQGTLLVPRKPPQA